MNGEIIAQRVFNTAYIYLDTAFLIILSALLIIKRKYLTLLFALFGGILYFIVDYGIFHLALGTRSIEGGSMFWVLLWMSLSYGMTNFMWIWLWFSRDEHKFEWTLLILVWWLVAPMLADMFSNAAVIKIQRTTGKYHGFMGLILLAGYACAIVYNLMQKEREKRLPVLWLLITGITVQLGWEFMLLAGGIRSAEFTSFESKLTTLVINSLLETNLGAVPLYCIYVFISARINEDLKPRKKVSFLNRISELNAIPLFASKPHNKATLVAESNDTNAPRE